MIAWEFFAVLPDVQVEHEQQESLVAFKVHSGMEICYCYEVFAMLTDIQMKWHLEFILERRFVTVVEFCRLKVSECTR